MNSAIVRAKAIKLVIFDVDGVLTNGSLWFDSNGEFCKAFSVYDGLGIKLLQRAGIETAVITARNSPAVAQRLAALKVNHYYYGVEDKRPAYRALLDQLNLTDSQVAYLGDDLPDLALIRHVGLGATVANANPFIKEHAQWQSTRCGGDGAAREFCEFILTAQDKLHLLQQDYLEM
jgi:3-deoxy-D-manno-octulosonate 8-phosphate phosphatase (KDO 8-P phosphatase)